MMSSAEPRTGRTAMTSNHDYTTPTEGTLDWHVPLNANFELIDTDVEVRDVEANLSDYEPKDGAKFLATDTGAVYVGTGSSWTALGRVTDNPDISVQSAEPSDPGPGDVWIETS